MSFRQSLERIVNETHGSLAAMVMGFDGIAIDLYNCGEKDFDLDTFGIEISQIIDRIKETSQMLETGWTREIVINTDQINILIRLLNDEYFLALAIENDGYFGKGRYLMRVEADRLLEEL